MADSPPKRMLLIPETGNRDSTTGRDARLVNGFVEFLGKDDLLLYKRGGLTAVGGDPAPGAGNGVYRWGADIYTVVGANFYKNNVLVGAVASGKYRFSSTLGATPVLFLKTTSAAYTYDGATLTQVVDVDYPVTTVPGLVYLNGTTYIMDSGAHIYGTDTNDPQVIDPLDMLVAQIEPDGGVALAKQLVYVVALKEWSTEVFYDAGNPTGSPLATVQGAKINYGCRWAESLQELDGSLFWVGQTRSGPIEVLVMDGLKVQPISDPRISRLLESFSGATIHAWRAKYSGHKFYGISDTAANLTLVYDVGQKRWYEWASPTGDYWPISASDFAADGQTLLQHATTGALYKITPTSGQDAGVTFQWDLYTPEFDGENRYKKYLNRMDLVGDQQASGTLDVRYTEDDYGTWSDWREWDLTQARPSIFGCGSFTKRAWNLRHAEATPLRIRAVDFQILMGTC